MANALGPQSPPQPLLSIVSCLKGQPSRKHKLNRQNILQNLTACLAICAWPQNWPLLIVSCNVHKHFCDKIVDGIESFHGTPLWHCDWINFIAKCTQKPHLKHYCRLHEEIGIISMPKPNRSESFDFRYERNMGIPLRLVDSTNRALHFHHGLSFWGSYIGDHPHVPFHILYTPTF